MVSDSDGSGVHGSVNDDGDGDGNDEQECDGSSVHGSAEAPTC